MRIERVEAHVFGPLKGETLELAPGMTVVHGPNEAGKSSWHAALYAGLCGRRRGPGAGTREDRAFAERHRPWHSERWEVGVVVALSDGRKVELRHDLAGGVDCRATDLELGRDVSDEIMFEGAPDGARWLGLNRRTLPATVCVRQTDVLGILDDPGLLQEGLQRAAATGGADSTAEQALLALATFRRERVGLDRRNSTKPLRRAVETVQAARASLAQARSSHEEYVQLVAQRDRTREEAARAVGQLAEAREQHARAEAEALRKRLERAEALAARAGQGEPPEVTTDDELAERVSTALAAHDARPPAAEPLEGEDAGQLAAALAALPPAPEGDTEPAVAVVCAYEEWDEARQAVRAHDAARPVERPVPETGGFTTEELRRLADALETVDAPVDPALRAEAERLRAALDRTDSGMTGTLAAVCLAMLVAGGAAVAAGLAMVAGVLVALGLAAGAGSFVASRRARPTVSPGEVTAAEARLAIAEERQADARRARDGAREQLAAAAITAEAAPVRSLARTLEASEGLSDRLSAWQERSGVLAGVQAEAAARLWEALRARGESLGDAPDPAMAFKVYGQKCRQRAVQASHALRREDLERRLRARGLAEQDARDRRERRDRALELLRSAAVAAGELPDGEADDIAERLREWRRRRSEVRRAAQQRREAWVELQHLLDGRTLQERREELAQRQSSLREQPPVRPPSSKPLPDLETLQAAEGEAARRAAHLEGQVDDRGRDLPCVAGVEEQLSRAEEELSKVRELDATLERTQQFLEAARDRVHRDIAPQLKAAVERRLHTVTAGRYTQVAVDPATLAVMVRAAGAPWRAASSLSHGTAEQVYLLLRLALAEHLVSGNETAPLVLDDVTVQFDHDRTESILDLLHEASTERQVVVFTQEEAVVAWAARRLSGPRDALIRLETLGVGL